MKTIKNKLALLLLAAFAISCSSSDDGVTPDPLAAVKDVYVAGYEKNSMNVSYAKYWKNGVGTTLGNGINSSRAESVFVAGNDIYVAGGEYVSGTSIAKYWKNGVSMNLTSTATDANATAIFVVGSDVYVAGCEKSGSHYVAKYWKNGIAVSLSNGVNDAYANDILVSGSDVYVCGTEYNSTNTQSIAKYWKNGITTDLSALGSNTGASSIALSGNDVYITGSIGLDVKYWKNGVAATVAPIPAGSSYQYGFGIAVNGSNIYVAGFEETPGPPNARLWTNGVPTSLNTNGQAYDVAVAPNGDTYVVGRTSSNLAQLWYNGTATTLSTAGVFEAQARDVFLTFN